MTILVFGKSGQVATELRQHAGIIAIGRNEADLGNPAQCAEIIAATSASAIINAAAYTAVDNAEDDAAAFVVNGEAPASMARAAASRGLPFVHISTDYVFDGSGSRPWRPDDATAPLNAYGRTKRAGEEGVLAAGGPHAILRTSWVFSAHGANFVKTMLRLSETRDRLAVVADQIGGPTPAADIASACIGLARALAGGAPSGIHHFAGEPDASWADFAREIFRQSGRATHVDGIPAADYPVKAIRPANSRLDCTSLASVFGIKRPDWRDGLANVLQQLGMKA